MQKGEHVKDNRAKRSNVEVTSIVGGRLLSCVRRVLSYTWHRERHVELLVIYDQTFGTRTTSSLCKSWRLHHVHVCMCVCVSFLLFAVISNGIGECLPSDPYHKHNEAIGTIWCKTS